MTYRKVKNFFTSLKAREMMKDAQNGVRAAEQEREWVEREIAPKIERQVAEAKRIIESNGFEEKLSRTFQRRSVNGVAS